MAAASNDGIRAFKVRLLDLVMRITPGLRTVRAERQILIAQVDAAQDTIKDLRDERDRLLHSVELLLSRR